MRYASISAVIAATLLVLSTHAQERAAPAGKNQTDESVKKVKELKKERVAVLKELTDSLISAFKAARRGVEYDEVLEAQRLLAEAELDAAETDKDRVELCEKLVAVLKQREKLAEAEYSAARQPKTNLLRARASRLEAEIRLEQVKMKVAGAGK